ncbi:MAG TPA: helix-turn-helix transcriptional regulator, partial [Burkholderiales bacterium]|nr:helix-turn-helix transcriptional regulator [Burkholderiales bacterium]
EREVLRCLCDGVPTLADLTERLGMSARTLQRQLAAERASLRGIIDNVRRSAALQHLTDNMPLTDIGYLLGFRDTRSFFRAFKRWTGTTPLAWRSKRAGRKRA